MYGISREESNRAELSLPQFYRAYTLRGVQPEALSVTEPTRQPGGGGKQRQISECLGTFAGLPLGLVQLKAGLDAYLGPSHAHPCNPAEAATNL